MICSRCGDGLVEDRFMDWTARWRCFKCGHVQDSLSVQSLPTRPEESRAITEPQRRTIDTVGRYNHHEVRTPVG
jgi:hypothetical protein